MLTNGHDLKSPPRASDALTTLAGLAVLSPVLALPVGLAWRALRWAAGL